MSEFILAALNSVLERIVDTGRGSGHMDNPQSRVSFWPRYLVASVLGDKSFQQYQQWKSLLVLLERRSSRPFRPFCIWPTQFRSEKGMLHRVFQTPLDSTHAKQTYPPFPTSFPTFVSVLEAVGFVEVARDFGSTWVIPVPRNLSTIPTN